VEVGLTDDVSEENDAAIFRVKVERVRVPKWSFRLIGVKENLRSGLQQ
jgi:hypothetical protein